MICPKEDLAKLGLLLYLLLLVLAIHGVYTSMASANASSYSWPESGSPYNQHLIHVQSTFQAHGGVMQCRNMYVPDNLTCKEYFSKYFPAAGKVFWFW